MSIKYRYDYDGLEYYMVCKLDSVKTYPLFNAKSLKVLNDNIEVLDYILNAIRIKKENKYIVEKYLKISKCDLVSVYENDAYIYIVFSKNNQCEISKKKSTIFSGNLTYENKLGILLIDNKLQDEILELDQILQSAISIDLVLELMEENEDMCKYINLIKEEVKNEHLNEFFFFDDFVHKIFMKAFIEVLNENRLFNKDEFIKFLGEISE